MVAGILNIRKGDEKKEMRKLLRSWHEWMLDGKVAARYFHFLPFDAVQIRTIIKPCLEVCLFKVFFFFFFLNILIFFNLLYQNNFKI